MYAIDGDQDVVVKSSVVGELRYIKREPKALQVLSTVPYSRFMPQSIGRVQYGIRGTDVDVPAFLMSPQGCPVLDFLERSNEDDCRIHVLVVEWS